MQIIASVTQGVKIPFSVKQIVITERGKKVIHYLSLKIAYFVPREYPTPVT